MGCIFGKEEVNRSQYDMNPVKKLPVIFVAGVPGAGNKTTSQSLSALTGYHVINPEVLVHAEAAKHTTLRGMSISKMLEEKSKIPEETIIDLVKEEMLDHADSRGFIMCGFPKNRKQASLYNREVKMPEKIISLQVADEIATLRLQKKMTELGMSEKEIRDAEHIVKMAVPKLKRVNERFRKDSVVTINNNTGNLQALYRSIESASESFKDLLKTPENIHLLNTPAKNLQLLDSMENVHPINSPENVHLISSTENMNLASSSDNIQLLNLSEAGSVCPREASTTELGQGCMRQSFDISSTVI